MKESPQDTTSTLARIESTVNFLKDSFTEFKVNHKGDIDLLHTLREKLEARVQTLENDLIHRKSGIMSARTIIEGLIGVAAFLYYILEMKK